MAESKSSRTLIFSEIIAEETTQQPAVQDRPVGRVQPRRREITHQIEAQRFEPGEPPRRGQPVQAYAGRPVAVVHPQGQRPQSRIPVPSGLPPNLPPRPNDRRLREIIVEVDNVREGLREVRDRILGAADQQEPGAGQAPQSRGRRQVRVPAVILPYPEGRVDDFLQAPIAPPPSPQLPVGHRMNRPPSPPERFHFPSPGEPPMPQARQVSWGTPAAQQDTPSDWSSSPSTPDHWGTPQLSLPASSPPGSPATTWETAPTWDSWSTAQSSPGQERPASPGQGRAASPAPQASRACPVLSLGRPQAESTPTSGSGDLERRVSNMSQRISRLEQALNVEAGNTNMSMPDLLRERIRETHERVQRGMERLQQIIDREQARRTM